MEETQKSSLQQETSLPLSDEGKSDEQCGLLSETNLLSSGSEKKKKKKKKSKKKSKENSSEHVVTAEELSSSRQFPAFEGWDPDQERAWASADSRTGRQESARWASEVSSLAEKPAPSPSSCGLNREASQVSYGGWSNDSFDSVKVFKSLDREEKSRKSANDSASGSLSLPPESSGDRNSLGSTLKASPISSKLVREDIAASLQFSGPRSPTRTFAESQSQNNVAKHSVAPGTMADDFASFAEASIMDKASLNSNGDQNLAPEEALVQYLVSMGMQNVNARRIASSFIAHQRQQEQRQRLESQMESSLSTPQSQRRAISSKAQVQQEIEQLAAERRSMHSRMGSLNRAASVATSSEDSFPETLPRNYQRFDEPGAVEMPGRAFGAPRRPEPECMTSDSDVSALQSSVQESIVVEAHEVFQDEECLHSQVIILAESKPLSLKTALKERPIRRLVVSGVLVILATIAGTVCYLFLYNNKEQSVLKENSPTVSPTFAPTIIKQEILEKAAEISGWDAFTDSAESAQYSAVGWLSSFDQVDHEGYGESFEQRYALIVFYFCTNGTSWLDQEFWLNPSMHECDWSQGLSCTTDGIDRRVLTGLDATHNGLSGFIPSEIGLLRQLDVLVLAKNNITGRIPDGVTNLPRVTVLDLSTNSLTGTIPLSIGNVSNLMSIDLSHNNLTGSIPESLYSLSLLRMITLSHNQLSGTISEGIGNLEVLTKLDLMHNRISGRLRTEYFEGLKSLDFFWLDFNELTGQIGSFSAIMGNILEISLSQNKLSGTLPISLPSQLQALDSLSFRLNKIDVSYNKLNGTLGMLAAFIPTLKYFDLSGNMFAGSFPGNEGWPKIEFIAIDGNGFVGTIPTGFPSSLRHLSMSHNMLTGTIPTGLCNHPNVEFLSVSSNGLKGSIPTCFTSMSRLRHLDLSATNIVGTITPDFGKLDNLDSLSLSWNALSGIIPSELGQAKSLCALDLQGNDLVGSIPSEIGNLSFLKTLNLGDCRLSGQVPSELGRLSQLNELTLAGNSELTGNLPEGLCFASAPLTSQEIGCSLECPCCTKLEACGDS